MKTIMLMATLPLLYMQKIVRVTCLTSLILISFVSQKPEVIAITTFFLAFYAIFHGPPLRLSHAELLKFICICALFLPVFINSHYGFSPFFYIISTLATFYVAKSVAANEPKVLLAAFRLIFTIAVAVIGLALYIYWGSAEPFEMLIEGSSGNGVPAYLIVIQIGLSLTNFLVNGRLPIASTVITGAVAFFGNGRGSLVIAGMIIFVSLLFNLILMRSASRSSQLRYFTLFFLLLILFAWNGQELIDFIISHTKLSVGLMDVNRIDILQSYIQKIDLWTLIVGADYEGTIIETIYNGNPHIAFIRTHVFFGLPLTLIVLLSPIAIFIGKKKLGAKFVFGTFIAIALLRAISEPIFFPTLLDFFYFLYFFIFFRYAPARGPKLGASNSF